MTKKEKAKPGTSAELAELYPAPHEIKVRVGKEEGQGKRRRFVYEDDVVVVSALPIQQLGALIDTLAPLVNDKDDADILTLATEHRGIVYAAFAQATGWSAEDVGRIHPTDFISAVQAIVDANADFFVRLLGPAVFGTPGNKALTPGNGAGPTPSTTSTHRDTPIPSATHSPSSRPQ